VAARREEAEVSASAAPEKRVEADCIKALKTMGFYVSKMSQPQRARGMSRGIPDLYAAHPRWQIRTWIEVKAGKGKPSAYQLAWHRGEREAGGNVTVVWSVADLVAELRKLGAPLA
jgi:hypothetical protein